MMERLRGRFIPQYDYDNPLLEQRAGILLFLLYLGVGITALVAVGLLLSFSQGNPFNWFDGVLIATPLLFLVLGQLVQRGRYRIAALAFLGYSLLSTIYYVFVNGLAQPGVVLLVLPLITAGLLLDWQAVLLTAAATILGMTLLVVQGGAASLSLEGFAILLTGLLLAAGSVALFEGGAESMSSRLLSETRSLRQAAEAPPLTMDEDEEQLVAQMLNIVQNRLRYDHAQVYLVNDGHVVTQRITWGISPSQMVVQPQPRLSRASGIYQAIQERATQVLDARMGDRRTSHLLRGMQRGVAIPLRFSDQVLGVLDVQSERPSAFSAGEVTALTLLAKELGNALGQTRLMNELRRNLDSQNKLVTRQREKLLSYERAERLATLENWSRFLEERGVSFMGFDMDEDDDLQLAYDLPEDLHETLQRSEITIEQEGAYQRVRVPIVLQGQVLGAMSFRVPSGTHPLGARQQEFIRSVTERLTMALENRRLFEQSQIIAQRERKANEVGSALLEVTDIRTLLERAAREFNEALGAVQTRIHLQPQAKEITEEHS